LLAPAHEALTDRCLTGPITEYPWVEAIALMTIFVLLLVEMIALRSSKYSAMVGRGHTENRNGSAKPDDSGTINLPKLESNLQEIVATEALAAQLTSIFVLEFGIIFHSIFIGLTLAVAGEEFKTLYVVLVFHQTFEGLGLGTRLSAVPWYKSQRWIPYLLGVTFALSTPIAIAIGLGVRTTYPPSSQTTLVTNGVFDSISAGILIYTGLIELIARDFVFSEAMRGAKLRTFLSAYLVMCLGAGLMALLGKWA